MHRRRRVVALFDLFVFMWWRWVLSADLTCQASAAAGAAFSCMALSLIVVYASRPIQLKKRTAHLSLAWMRVHDAVELAEVRLLHLVTFAPRSEGTGWVEYHRRQRARALRGRSCGEFASASGRVSLAVHS